MFALIGRDAPLIGRAFYVEAELPVGREGSGLVLDDASVSRRHAALQMTAGTLTVRDLGSLNGTFVNGHRIDAVTHVRDGDIVEFGAVGFVVRSPKAAPPGEAAAIDDGQPFGTYGDDPMSQRGTRRSRVASRHLAPEVVTVAAITSTAAGLMLYFGLR